MVESSISRPSLPRRGSVRIKFRRGATSIERRDRLWRHLWLSGLLMTVPSLSVAALTGLYGMFDSSARTTTVLSDLGNFLALSFLPTAVLFCWFANTALQLFFPERHRPTHHHTTKEAELAELGLMMDDLVWERRQQWRTFWVSAALMTVFLALLMFSGMPERTSVPLKFIVPMTLILLASAAALFFLRSVMRLISLAMR
jgi:hypothetical protein